MQFHSCSIYIFKQIKEKTIILGLFLNKSDHFIQATQLKIFQIWKIFKLELKKEKEMKLIIFVPSANNPLIFDYDLSGAFESVLRNRSAFKISLFNWNWQTFWFTTFFIRLTWFHSGTVFPNIGAALACFLLKAVSC